MMDRDQLAADLAKAHGIRIDADDPILITALLNRHLLDDAIAALEVTVRMSADRTTAASVQQVDAARQAAGILVTQAGEWSAERLSSAARDATVSITATVGNIIDDIDRSRRIAILGAFVSVCVPLVILAGVLGYWLAGVLRG